MIKVIEPGLYSNIQDHGRFGYRNIGVPYSGFMDQESARTANKIVGNDENESLIEITLMGPTLLFNADYILSITGADFSSLINNDKVDMYKPIHVKLGDTLKINHSKYGARCYLAISGGIDVKSILGSKSSFKGITTSYFLKKGDEIKVIKNNKSNFNFEFKSVFKIDSVLNVFKGPEFNNLKKDSVAMLLNKKFTIGVNNRMGYNLNEKLQIGTKSIISSPVLPGTTQLTPSGNIIVLHRDCQTSGGYNRILQLDEKSLNDLSQLKAGQIIRFKLINK
jgi:biotin-dependent carboxylase-like uncharacterized protein|tara:strand:- start:202 stop:1038 length:837 start_codon:yes stop_codon:yes gene_type:complete